MKKILLGICTLGLLVGCGSTSDSDGLNDQTITIDELPAAYAKISCDVTRACWGDVFDILVAGENCEANAETGITDELPRIKSAIEAGKVRYDGKKFQACIDAIKARGCVDAPEPAECTAALDGTVDLGGDCTMNIECKGPETYCKSSAACPGKCTATEPAGTTCQRDSQCAAGLQCSDNTHRCAQPAAAGADCKGASAPNCGAGLICVGDDSKSGQSGKCQTLTDAFSVAAGGACLLSGAAFCKTDLRCAVESVDPVTQTITTRCSPPVASGASCKLAYPDVCPFDQYCAVPAQSIDGTCRAKPGSGQPCAARGSDAADICAPGTRCDGGICRSLQKLGGSCQTDDVCYSGTCAGGGCASAGACE